MLYTIIITNADGKKTYTSTDAPNAKKAHENAKMLAPGGATVRVYPTTQDEYGNINAYAVLRGALQVAKKSAEKTLTRTGGTDTQQRIANELKSANARAGQTGAEQLGATYIMDIISKLSADSQDIFGYAYDGILTAINDGAEISEQYHNAFLTINAYVKTQRRATEYETSTEFIEENGGKLVAVSSYIARIIKGGERYTPTDNNNTMDRKTAERLGDVLSAAAVTLTPRQKDITLLLVRGYSQRKICEKLNIKSVATVNEHITHIRKKYLNYITENAPEFLTLIDTIQVNTSEQNTIDKRDRNKHNAEYYRQYRAKKNNTEHITE